jgi:hypothetical protein
MRWIGLSLVLALGSFSATAATIEARLIRASNDKACADDRLKDLEPKLRKVFGYPAYQQIGIKREPLKADTRVRLDLGEGFVVFAALNSSQNDLHKLDLEWYSGRMLLVKTGAKLRTNHYLFYKGQPVGNDWILLVITVRD